MVPQNLGSFSVERHPPLLVRLQRRLHEHAVLIPDRPSKPDRFAALIKRQRRPPHRADLASPSAGGHCGPDQCTPIQVVPRSPDDSRSLLGSGWLRVRLGCCRRQGFADWADADPPPSDSSAEGARKQEVDVANGRGAERAADMRAPAPAVTFVLARGPVVRPSLFAVRPASAQLCVERVEDVGIDLAHFDVAKELRDVVADVASVVRQSLWGTVELVEIARQQLVDGGRRSWVPALCNVVDEPVTYPLGLPPGPGTRRHDSNEVVPSLRHGVNAGVHADAEGTARQLVDAAAISRVFPVRAAHHDRMVAPACVTSRVTRSTGRGAASRFCLVKRGAGGRDRTDDLPLTRRLLYH